jgi:hypothetical protein
LIAKIRKNKSRIENGIVMLNFAAKEGYMLNKIKNRLTLFSSYYNDIIPALMSVNEAWSS